MANWVILVLGFAVVALAIRWWLNHPRPAILGQSDLSNSIDQMLRWTEDGGRFTLDALDRGAAVSFTRLAATGRSVEVKIELASDRLDQIRAADLESEFKLLGVPLLGQDALVKDSLGRDVLCLTTRLPADARVCGSLADLALRVVGLTEGDRYRYRFEGSVDTEQLRKDAVERTHVAGAEAPLEWQASIFRRMSRLLRATSSSAKARGSGEKLEERDAH